MVYEGSRRHSSRRSSSIARTSTSRRLSTVSRDTSQSAAVTLNMDENNTEIFDGAGSEIVPTSISSFHHPHHFTAGYHQQGNQSQSVGTGPSSIPNSAASSIRRGRSQFGSSYSETHSLMKLHPSQSRSQSRARSQSIDSRRSSNFQFFNAEDVESAHGAATLYNPEDPIDYDTNWGETAEDFRRGSFSNSVNSFQDYGSITRPSSPSTYSPAHTYRDRIPSDVSGRPQLRDDDELSADDLSDMDSDEERGRTNDTGNSGTGNNATEDVYIDPELFDHYFSGFKATLHFQRFYIAEEDLVLGIAGYRTSKIRLQAYYVLCVLTFGLAYLFLRWLPKYRFALYGEKVPLAKAEWVVIETEHGELDAVDVQRKWFNRSLSTIMNIPQLHDLTAHENLTTLNINPNIPILISFEYRYLKLHYSPVEDIFKTNTNWVDARNWLDLEHIRDGLSKDAYDDRVLVFNENSLTLKEKSVSEILTDEILHPFYMFQVFSIILWAFDEYYYYAACIFLISFVSVLNTLQETKQTMKRLAELGKFECRVRVWRNGFWKETDSSDLVPGDIYEVSDPSLGVFPCDSVLLSGDCIVNESMLTGESVPVSKLPANDHTLQLLITDSFKSQISTHLAKSYLFNGTKIIRVRHNATEGLALALVVKTGFATTKGSLLRSMLFPKPTGFKFYEDSFKYIGFMTLIAMVGFVFSTYNFIKLGLSTRVIILRALDIVTIVVPPALPATLTIGTSFALSRLKKKDIFCIAPTRVNVGGKLDVLCFDKTGTLTEDGLDVYGVHANSQNEKSSVKFDELITNAEGLKPVNYNLLKALSSCHSLRVVDGELIGDPLDFKMFEFTQWKYEEEFSGYQDTNESRNDDSRLPENLGISPSVVYPSTDPSELLGIVRSFEFVSHLRCMSVIIKANSEFSVFTKGAPEVIKDICHPGSFPANYEELLHHYTHNGYRVIACAGKPLKKNTWLYSQKITREEAESGLEFLGFIVFENRLKPTTTKVLAQLNAAKLRTVMCTGDNLLTAVSVGRECGLVTEDVVYIPEFNDNIEANVTNVTDEITWRDIDDETSVLDSRTLQPLGPSSQGKTYSLAITGDVFRYILKNQAPSLEATEDGEFSQDYTTKILLKANIFARMSPDEKHELVEQLQSLDYTVGFCGDGANDCGALKAADVGISLSEAEASVAAPFTSRNFEISCVLDVIREGRAALVTSFSCFQYMSLYSAIQFITITVLYKRGSNLGDFQFLWIDLFLILPIAIFMSWSNPYPTIVAKRPSANLISPKLLIPLVVNIALLTLFQIFLWQYVQTQPWYLKPVPGGDDAVQSSDNTVLFFFSNFQYILVALILTVGRPYREPVVKNIPFILNVIVAVALCCWLMGVDPHSWIGELFQLTEISGWFKVIIVLTALINLGANSYIPPLFKGWFKKRQSFKRYKRWLRNERLWSGTV
ncbi:hypothetical protein WICPIJ_006317 [Wickerhamomyces pijperi]|uniref:Cation-transporting ATPase n=1 Tax=Wickerhamomyces pijperi TaxID=599730 RepID=A0A9P8TKZ5_WICPI|nr:hypothetical protein WICPIJ_006317 [Wickerhamomyces pijperi]